ncbi:MAG: tetratricopeptide repeat protein [Candidatus Omnitrophica bacterium]|nr:tetratricopeptide repeat protein [Candidatus Omnitrophota bacterium]
MRPKIIITVLIFFLALAARVVYLGQVKDEPVFLRPFVDSGDHHASGMRASGWSIIKESPYDHIRIPFYQKFLGLLYSWGMPSIYFATLVQAVIGALGCVLVYLIATELSGEAAGIISGAVCSIYWPLIAFTAKTLPVNLAVFFGLLAVFSVCVFYRERRRAWALAAGVMFALASLTRPNFLILVPVFAIWMGALPSGNIKQALGRAGYMLLGFSLVMALAVLMDYSQRKEIIPVQQNYAVTVYMGTDLALVDEMRPGSAWRAQMRELLEEDLVSRGERDLYWAERIKRVYAQDPAGALRNLMKKLYLIFNRYEFAPYENINFFRKKSAFLSLPLADFGWVAALAVFGMAIAFTMRRREMMPLLLFAGFYILSLLPFPPLARYRLPVVPVMVIFASYCLVSLVNEMKKARWSRVSVSVAVIAPLFFFTNINPMAGELESYTRPYYREGLAYLEMGRPREALDRLKAALYLRPDDADIYETLGDAYMKLGDLERARTSYQQALRIEPRFPEAMEKLAIIYAQQGKLEKAVGMLKEVIRIFPAENATTRINLAACYSKLGDDEKTEEELKKALMLEPGNIQALYLLTSFYERKQRPEADRYRQRLNSLLRRGH